MTSNKTPRRSRRGYLQPNRKGKSRVGAYFSFQVRDAIREVADRKGIQVQDIITEAYRDVLRKYGVKLPPELKPRS